MMKHLRHFHRNAHGMTQKCSHDRDVKVTGDVARRSSLAQPSCVYPKWQGALHTPIPLTL